MRILNIAVVATLASVTVATPAKCLRSEVRGYTVLEFTQVSGSFEGCEHGKPIKLISGYLLTCDTYSYSYSYSPDVVIFAKSSTYKGKSIHFIKACIDNELYDMQPVIGKN